jgi:hypothetical protein
MRFALAMLSISVLAPSAGAAVYYVDPLIVPASCTTYAPAIRSCGTGSDAAFKTLTAGVAAAVAGDTVQVRAGTYGERLVPPRSGTAVAPITIRRYQSEAVTISNQGGVAFALTGRSYLVIDGITATSNVGFARLEDSSNNVIQNCTFSNSTGGGTTSGFKLVRSTYNRVLNNSFLNAEDNVTIQDSDRNVFQGNVFDTAAHSLLSLRCGNFNIVRGNSFRNPDQKAMEIYDCEGTSDAPVKLDATKRNVVEGNVVSLTLASSQDYNYNGMQFSGQRGIVRRNVFYDNRGGAINIQQYSDEALFNYQNRLYHNTFYDNRCYGLVGVDGDSRYYDHRVRNSIFYKNLNCSGGAGQTRIDNPAQVILADNAVVTTPPGFVNEAQRDFHLATGSPMIDAAAFLTTTVGAGSGTVMTVADSRYFFDGYGIPGELGDLVQLQGQTQTARVLAVDDTARTLTLDTALTWTNGQGLTLAYNGGAPDQGAFESGGAGPGLPSITLGDVTASEGNSGTTTLTFTLALSAASTQAVTVSFATSDGTAGSPADYTAASGSRTFAPGQTTQTVAVAVVGDTVPEPNETFSVNLSAPVNAAVADGQGVGTIANDDLSSSSLSINDVSVTEGNSGATTATFTVALSPASTQTVSVSWATANGTATAGVDYTAANGTLTFAPGTVTRTVAVSVLGDTGPEPNETFSVNLSAPVSATIADGQGAGTIVNDDLPSLSIGDVSVTEGNSGATSATFTVTLSTASAQTVSVNWATANGTASAGTDYTASGGTLTFAPGTVTRTVVVPVLGDTVNEGNETFFVNLGAPANATLADAQGQGTIQDDDAAGLSISDVVVRERVTPHTSVAKFTVTLAPTVSGTVTVNWATADGTATAGSDYVAGSGTLTFNPGVATRPVNVTVNSDTVVEGPETFVVNLSGAAGASIARGTGTARIMDRQRGVDFNGDDRPDLLWRHDVSGENVLWFLNGANLVGGTFTTPPTLADVRWKMVGTNDFNGDGKADILWRHSFSGENVVWFMNGSTLVSGTFLSPSTLADTRWTMAGTGDFNLDGQADILWRHSSSGEIVVWFMNGAALQSGVFLTPSAFTDVNWQTVGTGDFNDDGKTDILWRHAVSGENVVWFLDGTTLVSGTFTNPSTLSDTRWRMVAIGDYNDDGKVDIAWRHSFSGQNVLWFMDGTDLISGTFTSPPTLTDNNWRIVGPR